MKITPGSLKELQEIMKSDYGVTISLVEVEKTGRQLIGLYSSIFDINGSKKDAISSIKE